MTVFRIRDQVKRALSKLDEVFRATFEVKALNQEC